MKKNGARCKLHLAIYGELLYDMKAVKNGMTFGDIAQLVERCVRNAEVRGSSPLISTKTHRYELFWFRNVFGLTRKLPQR